MRTDSRKLADDGKKNTYLAGFAGSGGGLWPTPEETKEMSPAFDAIFAAYRQREHGSPERVKFSRVASLQELAFLMPDVLRYAMGVSAQQCHERQSQAP